MWTHGRPEIPPLACQSPIKGGIPSGTLQLANTRLTTSGAYVQTRPYYLGRIVVTTEIDAYWLTKVRSNVQVDMPG